MECYVFIYLPGEPEAVPAGIFSCDPATGQGVFEYGRRYQARPDAQPVDPVALPLGRITRAVRTNGGLYGAFRDSSPDHWGRTLIAREQKVAVSALDEMDFLLMSNASRVGNLDFRTALDLPEPAYAPPTYQSLAELVRTSHLLQQKLPVSRLQEQMLLQGTSMGGARPKCTVEMDGRLWIAKFPSYGDEFDSARVEYASMTLARHCGIDVADVRLYDIGGRDVLLVKRFDREPILDGYARTGFLSALSLMEWDEDDRTAFSYVSIANRLRQIGHHAGTVLVELYRRMAFNVFCRNTDDHPRNHGFLFRDGRLELSPAYDITPTAAHAGIGSEFSLAMELGDQGRHASLENLLSRHTQFGLQEDEARNLLSGMAHAVAQWEELFLECGVSPADIDKFRGSFDTPLLAVARNGYRGWPIQGV